METKRGEESVKCSKKSECLCLANGDDCKANCCKGYGYSCRNRKVCGAQLTSILYRMALARSKFPKKNEFSKVGLLNRMVEPYKYDKFHETTKAIWNLLEAPPAAAAAAVTTGELPDLIPCVGVPTWVKDASISSPKWFKESDWSGLKLFNECWEQGFAVEEKYEGYDLRQLSDAFDTDYGKETGKEQKWQYEM